MSLYKIQVRLPVDRSKLGQLQVINTLTGLTAFGPVQCCGKADGKTAEIKGNISHDERKGWGNTPLGEYDVVGTLPASNDPKLRDSYGVHPRLRIIGKSGNASVRESVAKDTLRIHGGRPQLLAGKNYLRPTNGCLRLADIDMGNLITFLQENVVTFPLEMEVLEGSGFSLVDAGSDEGYVDPEM